MVTAGIEAMNVFAGTTFLDVEKLAQHRDLDRTRFENLMMKEKSLALPYEDPITFAVNAAKPIIDALSQEEKDRIKYGHKIEASARVHEDGKHVDGHPKEPVAQHLLVQ